MIMLYVTYFRDNILYNDKFSSGAVLNQQELSFDTLSYSIFTEVSPLSKKHIHSFNPKTNFLEAVLNQGRENMWNDDPQKEISKTGRFF